MPAPRHSLPILLSAVFALTACGGGTPPPQDPAPSDAAGEAPIVQPGAPGTASRTLDADDLTVPEEAEYTEADARFMRGMIPHHAQALVMVDLVPERTRDRGFHQLTLRMEISQRDEIALMERWLTDRGLPVPEWRTDLAHHDGGGMAGMPMMPGMLTPEQMERLRTTTGEEFERLFLEYMIQHHGGALVMVNELFATPGAAQGSEVFQFASHVEADQAAEIRRMQALLERY